MYLSSSNNHGNTALLCVPSLWRSNVLVHLHTYTNPVRTRSYSLCPSVAKQALQFAHLPMKPGSLVLTFLYNIRFLMHTALCGSQAP